MGREESREGSRGRSLFQLTVAPALSRSEPDFLALFNGQLTPMKAFLSYKMKITGNMAPPRPPAALSGLPSQPLPS